MAKDGQQTTEATGEAWNSLPQGPQKEPALPPAFELRLLASGSDRRNISVKSEPTVNAHLCPLGWARKMKKLQPSHQSLF